MKWLQKTEVIMNHNNGHGLQHIARDYLKFFISFLPCMLFIVLMDRFELKLPVLFLIFYGTSTIQTLNAYSVYYMYN